jgi:hypothetical protein
MGDVSEVPQIVERSGGERDVTGRFLPGHKKLGGRQRGIDVKALIRERKGRECEDWIVDTVVAIKDRAVTGDVQAAKLLWDMLCDKAADELHLTTEAVDMPDEEFARKVVSLLATLQARKAAVRN